MDASLLARSVECPRTAALEIYSLVYTEHGGYLRGCMYYVLIGHRAFRSIAAQNNRRVGAMLLLPSRLHNSFYIPWL